MKIEGEIAGGGGGGGRTTSFLIFLLWGGLMYYVFNLAPNQTPVSDYDAETRLVMINSNNFTANPFNSCYFPVDGHVPPEKAVLFDRRRCSKGSVPVFPFLILSFFLGAYGLIPYFVLRRPPPPPTEEADLKKWPLNFLESKLTAGITFVVGLGLIIYAGLATGDDWREYLQYFGGSKLIHVTSIDFALLSSFAPFWVYNDMSARKWNKKGFWLLPLSVIPFLGPALYLLLRPSLSTVCLLTSKEE
ncbi:hypothetical protein L2E82_25572 [Cichorium intybus]|uniref:Uncharacterized protein n=1 Tax=Cichorium intybus TaxID=13427 RepID=A0ACB9E408_CICIN|nr:hypothetical protein L2E82_25572 [Cichorium intybus]